MYYAPLFLFPLTVGAQHTSTPPALDAPTQVTGAVAPTLTLPWNTYTATAVPRTSTESTIWKFHNVRFGAPPVGDMRFGAPQSPTSGSNFSDPTGEISCWGVTLGPNRRLPGQPFVGRPEFDDQDVTMTEDCLFLDIYVPDSVNSSSSVPVIVWFYGGAYVFGSKGGESSYNPLYTGVGSIAAAQDLGAEVIFITGNYRLGAFGWLAGSQFQENGGLPNAGLYDQRLLLQWVQSYIHLLGGDKSQVSLWGQSAGAGSILHHLVATLDPLFSKALLQSPAFEWSWDLSGTLDSTSKSYAGEAQCPGPDLSCLRNLPMDDGHLTLANQQVFQNIFNPSHQFPFGPTVDGVLIKQLPVLSFAAGNVHKIDSIVVSHVIDEASVFTPTNMSQADFTSYVSDFIPQPSMSKARDAVATQYPEANYADASARYAAVIQDSSFTCNTRQLFDAYYGKGTKIYMLQYAVGENIGDNLNLAIHSADLLPTFWNADIDFKEWLKNIVQAANQTLNPTQLSIINAYFGPASGPGLHVACRYQSYLVSHALTGNPNWGASTSGNCKQNVKWLDPTTAVMPVGLASATYVSNVFQPSPNPTLVNFENDIVDTITPNIVCDFWTNLAETYITNNTGADRDVGSLNVQNAEDYRKVEL